jgi:hypothetical protein
MAVKKLDHKSTNGNGGGRVKFRYADAERYVDLDVTNVDQSVADQLKSVVSTLSGRTMVQPVRTLAASKAASAVIPEIENQEEIRFPQEGEQQEEDDAEETAAEISSNDSGTGQKRSYNFKPPKFMNELDFSTATKSLEDFAREKGDPTDVMDKYLLTIVWFKIHMKTEEVTVHHVYTAFDHVGWKSEMPVNPSVPLRDLKSKRHVLTREKGAAGYKVNFKGIQYVEKMGATK